MLCHNTKFCVAMFVFVVLAIFSMAVSALSMTTDELLERSLDSLRAKMDGAVAENQKLSAKNSSIRKRILFLKKEMRELDDQFILLKEQGIDLKNDIKADAQELKIEEKRFNNMLERKRYLTFERDTLKKQLETLGIEREMMEEEAEEISFDIQSMEGSVGQPVTSNLLDYYEEEKLELLAMLQESQKNVDRLRDDIAVIDLDIAGQLRKKEQALREQDSLKRSLSNWELRLKEEDARASLLNKGMDRLYDASKDRRKVFELENKGRRDYVQELTKIIDDFKIVQQDIEDQYIKDMKDIDRYRAVLKDENEFLYQYQQELQAHALLVKGKEAQEHQVMLLADEKFEIDNARRGGKEDIVEMQNELARKRQENESLGRDVARLEGEINNLGAKVKEAKNSVAVVRQDAFGLKRQEIEAAMKDQLARNSALEEKIDVVDIGTQEAAAQLELSQQRTGELTKELDQVERSYEEAVSAQEELLAQQQEIAALNQQHIAAFQQELQEMQMRRDALEASLDIVDKKHGAALEGMKDFDDGREELLSYLEVLKKENISLQKKLEQLQ